MSSTPYQTVLNALLSHPHIFISPPASPHKLYIAQNNKSSSSIPTISSLSLHPVIESLLHILNLDLPSAHFLCRHAEVAPKWESMYVHGMLHRIEGDIGNTRAWYGNVSETEVFRRVWDGAQRDDSGSEVPEIAKLGWEVFLVRLEGYRDRTKKRREAKVKGNLVMRTTRRRESGASTNADATGTETPSTNANGRVDVAAEGHHRNDSGSTTNDTIPIRPNLQTNLEITDWEVEERLLAETSLWEILSVLRFCEKKFGTESSDVKGAKGEFLGRIESGDERLAKIAQSMITGGEGWRVW